MARFRNRDIFGSQLRMSGPIPKLRTIRESLPGVRGFRVYSLIGDGPDTVTITTHSRIIARDFRTLELFIVRTQRELLGKVGRFESNSGVRYENMQLLDYRPNPPYVRCLYQGTEYFTVTISATLEQASL